MEYFVLYLLGNVSNISFSLTFIGLIISVIAPIAEIPLSESRGEYYKFPMKAFAVGMVMLFSAVLIPSERSVQYMAAYYVGKQAIQTETVKKLTELVSVKLDEEIKETLKTNSK